MPDERSDPGPGPGAGLQDDGLQGDGLQGDDGLLAGYATDLADAIEAALPGWVLRCVITRAEQAGVEPDDTLVGAAAVAGAACVAEVGPAVRELLATDVDLQRSTPLSVLRSAVVFPTRVLEARGIPPVERDDHSRTAFPGDRYDLVPASFADVAQELAEPGLVWGAAKAHVHLVRRRAEGLR